MTSDNRTTSARGHVAKWVNAAAQLHPASSFVATLINGYASSARQKSMKRMIDLLFERVEELEQRIDTTSLQKDEFAELFNSCLLMAAQTTSEEKIRVASEILSNCLLKASDPEKLSFRELDFFTKCVDSLSVGAVGVLAAMWRNRHHHDAKPGQSGSVVFSFGDIQKVTRHGDAAFLMGLVGELNRFNLAHLPGAPAIPTPDYGNYHVHLTGLGTRFAEYLLRLQSAA